MQTGSGPARTKMKMMPFDLDPKFSSNCSPDMMTPAEFDSAHDAAAARVQQGYDASGALGGEFSRENPPPGKVFGGYKKGNIGIVWK